MLPTIVFFLALLCSVYNIQSYINMHKHRIAYAGVIFVINAINCGLWAWLFYLLH